MAPLPRYIGEFPPFHPLQSRYIVAGLSPMPPDAHERIVAPGSAGFQPALSESAQVATPQGQARCLRSQERRSLARNSATP